MRRMRRRRGRTTRRRGDRERGVEVGGGVGEGAMRRGTGDV